MNKNTIQSIEKILYNKIVNKINEKRNQVAASLFEYRFPEEGTEPSQYPDLDKNEFGVTDVDLEKECKESIAKSNPNASKEEVKRLMEKCMGHNIQEAKKPTKKPTKKLKPKTKPAPEMAPISKEGRQSALDIMAKILLGKGSLGEEKLPEPVIARRIAGGMSPKEAKTKKLGFKGKKPGKG
jgi:hypothetical protein